MCAVSGQPGARPSVPLVACERLDPDIHLRVLHSRIARAEALNGCPPIQPVQTHALSLHTFIYQAEQQR